MADHLSARQTDPLERTASILLLIASALLLVSCTDTLPASWADSPDSPTVSLPVEASGRGRVDIEGGVIRLAARHDGIIAEVFVEEGDSVVAGQVLARLDDSMARRQLELAQAEGLLAEQEVKRTRVELRAAEREVRRLAPLADAGETPKQEHDVAMDRHAFATVAFHGAMASLKAAEARHTLAQRAVEERRITAPLDGRILQRQARPGNGVSTLNVTPLFVFAPDEPRIVRAEVEEHMLPHIRPEQAVEIVLEADTTHRWNGRVIRLGRLVGQRTPGDDPTEKQDNRVIEVVIAIDAPELLIGQRVVARFLKQ